MLQHPESSLPTDPPPPPRRAGYTGWDELCAAGRGDPGLAAALAEREAQLHPDDPINIQYTSGALCTLCTLRCALRCAEQSRRALPGAGPAVGLGLPLRRLLPTSCNRLCRLPRPLSVCSCAGTTGFPKAATLSHRNILNNGLFIARTCNYTHADRCVRSFFPSKGLGAGWS